MTGFSDLIGFETRAPSHQNAIDMFMGSWTSQFPQPSGLVAGSAGGHFDDSRVTWAASVMGGLSGLSILELGPFEGYNTYQFQMAGAATVISIESSRINFLKCLVVKNIYGLTATFLHGDFQKFLMSAPNRFDVCWASGVLYHMTNPIELLNGIRRVADTAFIWTHYYDEQILARDNYAQFFDPSRNRIIEFEGRRICLHHRNYNQIAGSYFSGGEDSYSYWLKRDDIMFILNRLGYNSIEVGIDNPNHPPGPAMFFLARAVPGLHTPAT
jgi:SAM-dependent methyltransferase